MPRIPADLSSVDSRDSRTLHTGADFFLRTPTGPARAPKNMPAADHPASHPFNGAPPPIDLLARLLQLASRVSG